MAEISSLVAVRAATSVDLDVRLYYAAVQNLVYRCANVPRTAAERSVTSLIHCDQYLQKSVDMSIQLPAGIKCDPVQMAEVIQQEYVIVVGAWFVSKSIAVTA